MDNKKVSIVPFEPWMLDGIVKLNLLQYGGDFEEIRKHYTHLLCSPYSKKFPPIALVGLVDYEVVSTQMFIYWPYKKGTIKYNVFQSANSLVHPKLRGQQLFQKMLAEGSIIGHQKGVDFFIGFPVPISYGAFIKDGWVKIGNLRWWIKILHPIKLFSQMQKNKIDDACLLGDFLTVDKILKHCRKSQLQFHMDNSQDFLEWRYNPDKIKKYRYFEYQDGNIAFIYKLSLDHGFREIIIGETYIGIHDEKKFSEALKTFCHETKKSSSIAAISFAIMKPPLFIIRSFLQNGFIPYKLSAPLVVKSILIDASTIIDARSLSIGDIDTW